MSTVSPLATDWIKNNLEWMYVYSPDVVPRTLTANQMVEIRTHQHPEGALVFLTATFNSSQCGVRLFAEPTLDTRRTLTINTLTTRGLSNPNVMQFTAIPPTTPADTYSVVLAKEWPWLGFIGIYVYNDDPDNSHNCTSVSYTLMVLKKERPTPSREIQQAILDTQCQLLKTVAGGT